MCVVLVLLLCTTVYYVIGMCECVKVFVLYYIIALYYITVLHYVRRIECIWICATQI